MRSYTLTVTTITPSWEASKRKLLHNVEMIRFLPLSVESASSEGRAAVLTNFLWVWPR